MFRDSYMQRQVKRNVLHFQPGCRWASRRSGAGTSARQKICYS